MLLPPSPYTGVLVGLLAASYLGGVVRLARTPEGNLDRSFLVGWAAAAVAAWWAVGRVGDLWAFFVLLPLVLGGAAMTVFALPVVAYYSWRGRLGELVPVARLGVVAVAVLLGAGGRLSSLRARTEHLQAHLVEVTERLEASEDRDALGEDPFAEARAFLVANPGIRCRITTRRDGRVVISFPIIRGDALIWSGDGWYWNDGTRKGPCCSRPAPRCAKPWGPYAVRHRLAGPDGRVPPLPGSVVGGWFGP